MLECKVNELSSVIFNLDVILCGATFLQSSCCRAQRVGFMDTWTARQEESPTPIVLGSLYTVKGRPCC